MVVCLELGCNPAVPACEVAAFGEVEIDLVETLLSFFVFFIHAYLFTTEAQSTQRKTTFCLSGDGDKQNAASASKEVACGWMVLR